MKRTLLLVAIALSLNVSAQTKLTQNTNQAIWSANSAACTTSGPGTIHNNQFIRVFDTQDFNVQDTVFFLYIELGVESTTGGAYELIGRIHELHGPVMFANMTLITADTANIYPDSAIYKMTIPLQDGYALPGDTIVTEVFAAINALVTFFPGSNPYIENDPSYIAAAGCGIPEPVTYASIGYPTAHLVLNLWVNHKPIMNDIALSTFKDNSLNLAKTDFDPAMTDYDNDTINMIQIMTLPANGTLKKNAVAVAIGDTIWSNELDSLYYFPNTGYFGNDDFDFRVRDNSHWSNDSINLDITVINWQLEVGENVKTNFEIYPNPASSTVQIKSADKILGISIYSSNGRLIQTDNSTVNAIDISDFADGIYFVEVMTEKGKSIQKFIKQ